MWVEVPKTDDDHECEEEHKDKIPAKQQLSEADQLLLKAADYLENNNWIQKQLLRKNDPTRVCAVGAMYAATGAHHKDWELIPLVFDARQVMSKYLTWKGERPIIEVWNDMPGRTKRDVIKAMREAATLDISGRKST